MSWRFRTFLLVAFLWGHNLWAQTSTTTDSLLEKADLSNVAPESVIALLSQSALALAEEQDRARIHDRIAHAYWAIELLDSASVHAWSVLRLAPDDKVLSSRAYALLGRMAFNTEAFGQSVEFYAEAGRLNELLGDKDGVLEALTFRARANDKLDFPEEALSLFEQARLLAVEIQNRVSERQLLLEMAVLSRSMGRFSNAQDYLNRSLSLGEGDTVMLARVRRELGKLDEGRFNYQGAKRQYEQVLTWVRSSDPFPLYHDLIRLSIELNSLDTAARYADSAEVAALQTGNVQYLRDCYQSRYLLAQIMKDTSSAHAFLLRFKTYDDSVKSLEMERRIRNVRRELFLSASEAAVRTAELQARLRDTRESNAKNEKSLTWLATGLGVACALLLALWFFTWRRSRDRIREEVAHTKDLTAKNAKVFAVMAHDLHGPVSTFVNITRSMPALLKGASPEDVSKLIKNFHVSAQELEQSLHELMDWAVTQSGAMSFRPEVFSCLKLAEQVREELRPWAEEHDVSSALLVPEGVTTYADRAMIKIVLRTLLFYGIRYSGEGETVSLFSGRKEDLITMGVRNNGSTIDKEAMERLMSWDREKGGEREKGVGLPMCRELVRRNGGDLYAESRPENGTTFYFTLPERPSTTGQF